MNNTTKPCRFCNHTETESVRDVLYLQPTHMAKEWRGYARRCTNCGALGPVGMIDDQAACTAWDHGDMSSGIINQIFKQIPPFKKKENGTDEDDVVEVSAALSSLLTSFAVSDVNDGVILFCLIDTANTLLKQKEPALQQALRTDFVRIISGELFQETIDSKNAIADAKDVYAALDRTVTVLMNAGIPKLAFIGVMSAFANHILAEQPEPLQANLRLKFGTLLLKGECPETPS